MAAIQHNSKLNDLVVDLGKSLLQYVWEGNAWTSDPELARKLQEWAEIQQQDVGRLVEFLWNRGWVVDLGTYPTDFTDLQFLSLKYLLPKLCVAQDRLVAELDEAVHTCVDDPDAVALLREILESERRIATQLCAVASIATPTAAVA